MHCFTFYRQRVNKFLQKLLECFVLKDVIKKSPYLYASRLQNIQWRYLNFITFIPGGHRYRWEFIMTSQVNIFRGQKNLRSKALVLNYRVRNWNFFFCSFLIFHRFQIINFYVSFHTSHSVVCAYPFFPLQCLLFMFDWHF